MKQLDTGRSRSPSRRLPKKAGSPSVGGPGQACPASIRQAQIGDLENVLALETGFPVTDRFSRRSWRYLLTRAHATCLVAELERPAGVGVVLYRKGIQTARLYSLVVAREARGRGVGRALLQACEQEAAGKGCRQILLEVRSSNRAAIALYEQAGWRVIRTMSGYYHDGQTGLKMEKELSPAQVAA